MKQGCNKGATKKGGKKQQSKGVRKGATKQENNEIKECKRKN